MALQYLELKSTSNCGKHRLCVFQLRNALANIYVRGAVPVKIDRKLTSASYFLPKMIEEKWEEQQQAEEQQQFRPRRDTVDDGTQTSVLAATLQVPQFMV